MPIDFSSEMSNILEIPEWFYELPVEKRNAIMNSALTKYTSTTITKNNTFLAYWSTLVEAATQTTLRSNSVNRSSLIN